MNSKVTKKDIILSRTIATILGIATVIMFLVPLLLVISISLTEEQAIKSAGFGLIPKVFSWQAYEAIFADATVIVNGYIVTLSMSFITMFLGTLVMAMCAYPLSRKNFALRRPIMLMFLFTMLFHAGLVPTYILNTQYLMLKNNFWIYVLPAMVSPFNLIILRTFFMQLPDSLVESAKIDGAKELRIFFQIVIPLSKPVLATIALLLLLDKWNDWMTSMLYILDEEMFSLQYLLYKILDKIEFMRQMAAENLGMQYGIDNSSLPGDNMRYAMAVVAAGPMVLIFPFFQKYFVKGLTVGAVKG